MTSERPLVTFFQSSWESWIGIFFKGAIHIIESMITSTKGEGGACTDLDVMVVTAKSWQVPRVEVTSHICLSLIIFISMYLATHSKQFWTVYNIKNSKEILKK